MEFRKFVKIYILRVKIRFTSISSTISLSFLDTQIVFYCLSKVWHISKVKKHIITGVLCVSHATLTQLNLCRQWKKKRSAIVSDIILNKIHSSLSSAL